MAFDVNGAKTAGYSDTEIADYLAGAANFNATGARKAGYSDAELIAHLVPAKAPAPPTSAGAVDEFGRNIGSVKFPTGQTQIGADFAAAGQGAVSGAGEAIAGIGRQLPEAPGARTIQQQIAVMDAIDAKRPVPQDQDVIGYQFFTPEQKVKAREDFTAAGVKADAEAEKREPNALIRAGTAMQEAAPGIFPVDPALEGRGTRVGRMVGGMVPALGASAVGALGGPVGAVMAGAAAIGAQTYDGTYQEAISKGSTPAEAESAAGKAAMAQMALTSVPISRVLPLIPVPLREGFMKTVANVGANFIQRGGEMSAGNTLASIAQNYIRSQTTDPGAPVFEGMGDTALDSFLAGLVVHGATSGAGAAVRGVRDIATAKDVDGAIAAAGSAVKDEPTPGSWGEIFPKGEEIPTVTVTGQRAAEPMAAGAAASRQGTPAAQLAMTPGEAASSRYQGEVERLAEPPKIGDKNIYIPGTELSLAEITGDPVVAMEHQYNRGQPAAAPFHTAREDKNAALLTDYYANTAGSRPTLDRMERNRDTLAAQNIRQVFGEPQDVTSRPLADTTPTLDVIRDIRTDPRQAERASIAKVIIPLERQFYDANGDLKTDPYALYGVGEHINDLLRGTGDTETSSASRVLKRELTQIKAKLYDDIERASPGFAKYRADYQRDSQAIDALKLLQDHRLSLLNNTTQQISPTKWFTFMKGIIEGRDDPMDPASALSESQMDRLWNITDQLKRQTLQDKGKPRGSWTSMMHEIGLRSVGRVAGHLASLATFPVVGNVATEILNSKMRDRDVLKEMRRHLNPNLGQGPLP